MEMPNGDNRKRPGEKCNCRQFGVFTVGKLGKVGCGVSFTSQNIERKGGKLKILRTIPT